MTRTDASTIGIYERKIRDARDAHEGRMVVARDRLAEARRLVREGERSALAEFRREHAASEAAENAEILAAAAWRRGSASGRTATSKKDLTPPRKRV